MRPFSSEQGHECQSLASKVHQQALGTLGVPVSCFNFFLNSVFVFTFSIGICFTHVSPLAEIVILKKKLFADLL